LSYLTTPTYETPLAVKGNTHSAWYRWFTGIAKGTPPSAEAMLTLGASPYAYTAPSKGFVIIRGGTVTAVQFTRSVTTLTGQTQGVFPLSQGDVLTITYSVLPTVTWVPQ
jgi:hypothetical protein